MLSLEALADRVRAGDRRALARAITLIESTRADHQEQAETLLERLLDGTGRALRVGITGTPGAGKSTFIERLGGLVVAEGRKIAVLAVDPSSRRSGGSILGDKTRMQTLAQAGAAFIRPSPAGTTVGGITRRTREAGLVCEAAGFDAVLIETVGVGQAETAVADMVDTFVLLLAPGGGDELQGIKRGIVELAHLIVINKADGELAPAAERARTAYRDAVQLLSPDRSGWAPQVLTCSALTGAGVVEVLDAIRAHREALEGSGTLQTSRAGQRRAWFQAELQGGLIDLLRAEPGMAVRLERLEDEVAAGRSTPRHAARAVLDVITVDRDHHYR